MKSPKIIFIYLVLFASIQLCFGQKKQDSILFDKFGKLSSHQLLANFDGFYADISETNSTGFIVIYETRADPLAKYLYQRNIEGCFQFRQVSDKNFQIAFVDDERETGVEFWKVPAGAQNPMLKEIKPDFYLSGMTRPGLVGISPRQEDFCALDVNLEFYSNFLKANPNITGKLVVQAKNLNNYRKVKQDYLRQLTKTHKIPQKQFYFVKARSSKENNVEFWLEPQAKK